VVESPFSQAERGISLKIGLNVEKTMKKNTKFMLQGAMAALIGLGTLAAATTGASARVVCNRDGDCWHTHDRYAYPAGFGITVHNDNWRWRHHDHYRWHEHNGRGYWRNGAWITF
jgi:hypothetical protein